MTINQLYEKAAKLGVVRITLGLNEKAEPTIIAEQFIKDHGGFPTHTQHQISAATHEGACEVLLHRAKLCSGIFRPMTLCEVFQKEDPEKPSN